MAFLKFSLKTGIFVSTSDFFLVKTETNGLKLNDLKSNQVYEEEY
jgi:hypothetical protein